MRRTAPLALALVIAATTLASAHASAAPVPSTPAPVEPPSKHAPPVEPRAARPPFISAVRRAPVKVGATGGMFTPAYEAGPIDFEAEIENPEASALETALVVEREGGARVARVPVEVAPGGKAKVTFTDALGLESGCAPMKDRVRLENGTSSRVVRVTPACSFTAELGEVDGARRETRRAKVSVVTATPISPAACGAPLVVRATLRNETKDRVTGALKLDGLGDGVTKQFTLRGGAEATVDVAVASYQGQIGAHGLVIDVPGEPSREPTWGLRLQRACTLDVAFETN